jgi:hypothetical protein
MTPEERSAGLARQRAYVAMLQPLMRLSHWEIEIGDKAPDDDALADNATYMREYRTEMRFSDRFFTHSPERRRLTTVHEMLHVVAEGWHRSNLQAFESLDATSRIWVEERHTHEMEMCVDSLSRIIAPFLPLPPTASEE